MVKETKHPLSWLAPRRRLNRFKEILDRGFAQLVRPRELGPSRRILVVGVYRDDRQLAGAVQEMGRSHHDLRFALAAMGDASPELAEHTVLTGVAKGKFQNVNDVLDNVAWQYEYVVVIDDDVDLPGHFLDDFVEVVERLDFALAQPAQDRVSNANWSATRRRFWTTARTTRFVEIGPVTLIRADLAKNLLPFPQDLRFGWGLDFHWAWQVEQAGFAMGIVDMCAVRHNSRKVASSYSWDSAQAEGEVFLRGVGHLDPDTARQAGRFHRVVRRRLKVGS